MSISSYNGAEGPEAE